MTVDRALAVPRIAANIAKLSELVKRRSIDPIVAPLGENPVPLSTRIPVAPCETNMTRTAHPPYDAETMLRVLRDDRGLPRTTRVEFRGITMNRIKTVADLLSKFRLAGHFRLIVDTDADPRFSLVRVRTGVVPLADHMMAARTPLTTRPEIAVNIAGLPELLGKRTG